MVIFLDLEDENEPPQNFMQWDTDMIKQQQQQFQHQLYHAVTTSETNGVEESKKDLERHNPNRNRITEALGCYPIISAIVSSLDLNTLDALSQTCRQIREGLLQYRRPLVLRTLRCYKECRPLDPEDNEMNWHYMSINESYRRTGGSCARDMVSECRRCSRPVCRNCVIRPPGPSAFKARHRRLCVSCTKAPLASLTRPPFRADTPVDAEEITRAVCQCATDRVWLCQPCGRNILGADQDYRSIWRWRNQYGEVLGGVGTGIGDGDRGVICGREASCLGSKERETEIDCDAADARDHHHLHQSHSRPSSTSSTPSPSSSLTLSSPLGSLSVSSLSSSNGSISSDSLVVPGQVNYYDMNTNNSNSSLLRPGYVRHEIEGIGGVVKTKLVRMMRVGACVPEWEDERSKGQILEAEITGRRRSCCGWCWRIIPSEKDLLVKRPVV
ncbi:hypothetical protein F5Y16DRAFT_121623 [Xylariaceae sp. FL0255]|nr:hypothetical protein F5Y16DRAFT_121623 [Xylariaceae sp. FL0255]